jgi:hypothetical protein
VVKGADLDEISFNRSVKAGIKDMIDSGAGVYVRPEQQIFIRKAALGKVALRITTIVFPLRDDW